LGDINSKAPACTGDKPNFAHFILNHGEAKIIGKRTSSPEGAQRFV
jgi:hypothetical protein